MISIKINDVNNFMQGLLVQDVFDSFLICDAEISASNTFSISGRINKDFYTAEELESMKDDFVLWSQNKHICFEIIKGRKVPTKMKLVFALPKSSYDKMIEDSGAPITYADVSGLYLHVLYENREISIVTGTSLSVFTMDKTLDGYWDKVMKNFLGKHFDIEEI